MAALIYLTYSTNKIIRNDAYVINSAGIVRGSIQRLSKMELSGCDQTCEDIRGLIDFKISELLNGDYLDSSTEPGNKFINKIKELKEVWVELKQLHIEYRNNSHDLIKDEIIRLSELCWVIADETVLHAQHATEYEVKKIKLIYPIAFLVVLCNLISIIIANGYLKQKLEYYAANDSLTGLCNRHNFEQSIDNEIFRTLNSDRKFSLIFFDIDHFKKINNKHGQNAGDMVLTLLASLIKSLVREFDIVSRIGGGEFSIIAPETDKENAHALAEKIRISIENHTFPIVNKITVSLGVTEYTDGCSKESLFKQANEAMHKAKEAGRNKTELYQ